MTFLLADPRHRLGPDVPAVQLVIVRARVWHLDQARCSRDAIREVSVSSEAWVDLTETQGPSARCRADRSGRCDEAIHHPAHQRRRARRPAGASHPTRRDRSRPTASNVSRCMRGARRASSCCCSTAWTTTFRRGSIDLDPVAHRTGPYWHAFVPGSGRPGLRLPGRTARGRPSAACGSTATGCCSTRTAGASRCRTGYRRETAASRPGRRRASDEERRRRPRGV